MWPAGITCDSSSPESGHRIHFSILIYYPEKRFEKFWKSFNFFRRLTRGPARTFRKRSGKPNKFKSFVSNTHLNDSNVIILESCSFDICGKSVPVRLFLLDRKWWTSAGLVHHFAAKLITKFEYTTSSAGHIRWMSSVQLCVLKASPGFGSCSFWPCVMHRVYFSHSFWLRALAVLTVMHRNAHSLVVCFFYSLLAVPIVNSERICPDSGLINIQMSARTHLGPV